MDYPSDLSLITNVLKSGEPFLAVVRKRYEMEMGQRDVTLMALKMEEGAMSQGM